jgi:hypothetical protein
MVAFWMDHTTYLDILQLRKEPTLMILRIKIFRKNGKNKGQKERNNIQTLKRLSVLRTPNLNFPYVKTNASPDTLTTTFFYFCLLLMK